ncbi:MAG: DUF1761 domain-containing protein [Pseudomonadota bacterium]
MDFAGLNYLAVLLAAVVAFMFGGAWYGILGKRWMAAVGKTEADLKEGPPLPVIMIGTFVAQLLMAWVLAGLIGHLGQDQVTLANGLISAGFVWVGFIVTTIGVNHAYQGQRLALTVIDTLHWLGVLLIQGAIIGAMGV